MHLFGEWCAWCLIQYSILHYSRYWPFSQGIWRFIFRNVTTRCGIFSTGVVQNSGVCDCMERNLLDSVESAIRRQKDVEYPNIVEVTRGSRRVSTVIRRPCDSSEIRGLSQGKQWQHAQIFAPNSGEFCIKLSLYNCANLCYNVHVEIGRLEIRLEFSAQNRFASVGTSPSVARPDLARLRSFGKAEDSGLLDKRNTMDRRV